MLRDETYHQRIRELVDAAPPLTDEQRSKIAGVFKDAPARPVTPAADDALPKREAA
jgi:hypothetical protein